MTDHQSTKTSTGHELSESSYLDSHFETMKPEYETMIRSVGIQSGWKVLDAGCGGGVSSPFWPNWWVQTVISVLMIWHLRI